MTKWNIFYIMGILATFSFGCTSPSEIESHETDVEISFQKSVTTKTIVTDINTKGASFGVFAKKANPFNNEQSAVFENIPQEVTFNGYNWEYTPVQKWFRYYHYYFVAYYPYSLTGVTIDAVHNVHIPNVDVKEQTDILISDHYVNTSGTPELICFNFKHILSNVNIQIKQSDWDGQIVLNDFKFNGMKVLGDFEEIYNGHTWTLKGDSSDNHLFNHAGDKTLSTKYEMLFEDILMIPQEINQNMNFDFSFTHVNNGNGNSNSTIYKKTINLALKGLTSTWQAGKKITYSINITPESIQFEPVIIKPWGEGEGENIPVLPQ